MSTIDSLLSNTPVFAFVAAAFGLIVGSFLNVVIHRIPVILMRRWHGECRALLEDVPVESPAESYNLLTPGSRCPHCDRPIRALENIPVISYLWLRGKCAGCRKPISLRYPVVELLSATLASMVAWQFGYGFQAVAAILLTWALVALTVIDIDHQLLPDVMVLPFLWVGLLVNLNGTFVDLPSAVIGAAAGYLTLWTIFQLFKLLTGKEGMGYGDFKLLALFGAWLGWKLLPLIILLSSFIGAIVGIGLIVFRGRDRAQPMPFGPYLAAAGWVAMLWGEDIVRHYLQLMRI